MGKRSKTPKPTETEVLQRSGRRCCLCVALKRDASMKRGQIAHLDHDPSNNEVSNLVFLCLDHHEQYDSQTSESKGLSQAEVKSYRDKLDAKLPALLSGERAAGGVEVVGDVLGGDGAEERGGDVNIQGGANRNGASGGGVNIGPGTLEGGKGGPGGRGGDLNIKGGDA